MKIECITYINLDYRKDKLSNIVNQLSQSKIINFKTSGIICEKYTSYPTISEIKNNTQRYKGTIGCFLAHLQAINSLIEYLEKNNSVNSYFMIMEDDLQIDSKFWDFLEKIEPKPEFDFIFFGSGRNLDPSKCLDFEDKLWPVYDDYPVFCGAFCYAISCQKIKIVKDIINNVKIYQDFDRFIFTNKLLNNVCYQTNLLKVNNSFSSDRDPTCSWKIKNV